MHAKTKTLFINATLVSLSTLLWAGCGADGKTGEQCAAELPYATEVVSFTAGEHAGFGDDAMPDVVLGAPEMGPPAKGSLDVLSLGVGGEIVLAFGDKTVLDGDGPDFIVWENAFWVGGDKTNVFVEFAEVSVSQDGDTWTTFPCDPELETGFDTGCAGWRPRFEYDTCTTETLRPDEVGGDPFDLASIGVTSAKYIRIRDLSTDGQPPSAGFDLDAVGAVYLSE